MERFTFFMYGEQIDTPIPGCICLHSDPRFLSCFIYRVTEVNEGGGGIGVIFSNNWRLLADRLTADYALSLAREWSHRQPETYVNLDGVAVTLDGYNLQRFNDIWQRGYMRADSLRGKVGCSELGVHTRTTEKAGIMALVSSSGNYAYVLLEDGTWLDGCYTRFADGSFSVA